jgi:NADP-dependent 3-hydroxy acid dehydrogenase YdfG
MDNKINANSFLTNAPLPKPLALWTTTNLNETSPRINTSSIEGDGLAPATWTIYLARAGVDVALVARSAEELERAKEEVSKIGHRALTLPTDLAKEEETSAIVERTVEEFGSIDVLVNAAGSGALGTGEELDVPDWDRTLHRDQADQD